MNSPPLDEHGVHGVGKMDRIARPQLCEIAVRGDGRVRAEEQVAQKRGVAEALDAGKLRKFGEQRALVGVAGVRAVGAVGAGRVRDTERRVHPARFIGVVPEAPVLEDALKNGELFGNAGRRRVAARRNAAGSGPGGRGRFGGHRSPADTEACEQADAQRGQGERGVYGPPGGPHPAKLLPERAFSFLTGAARHKNASSFVQCAVKRIRRIYRMMKCAG